METIDLLLALMPNATADCPECGKKFKASQAVKHVEGDWTTMFCSEECKGKATALLIKSQPTGCQIEGWDI